MGAYFTSKKEMRFQSQDALKTVQAVIDDADKERIEYLNGLNILLQSAIKDLQHDLGITEISRKKQRSR